VSPKPKKEPKFKKLAQSGWKAILQTVSVFLLTTGADQIKAGNYLVGGATCVIGFALFVVANYF